MLLFIYPQVLHQSEILRFVCDLENCTKRDIRRSWKEKKNIRGLSRTNVTLHQESPNPLKQSLKKNRPICSLLRVGSWSKMVSNIQLR